ncbi:MAG: hypothetical protein ACFBWO_15455 [Paracoccaceae bacterium]
MVPHAQPTGPILEDAHAVGREARVMHALGPLWREAFVDAGVRHAWPIPPLRTVRAAFAPFRFAALFVGITDPGRPPTSALSTPDEGS